jgi:enamine deaminase RidA (YjgF/YER057c/UK114 family)
MSLMKMAGGALLLLCAGVASAQCYQASQFEKDVGYCQAVRSGNTLYISGTAAGGDMPGAIKNVYGDLKKTLAVHGLTMADVVKETVYAIDLDTFIKHQDLRKAQYGTTFPAATWLQVSRLYSPKLVLEIELTATFPSK